MPEVLTTALRLKAKGSTGKYGFDCFLKFLSSKKKKETRKKDMMLEKHQIASFHIFHHVKVFTNIFARF